MNIQSTNQRIAKNTLLLYVRMLFLIVVQLYTVPIILKALGASDYGLYNVVGGVVSLFSFVGGSLASGSQRFLAYAMGKNDYNELKRVFNSTVTLYSLFSIITILVMETLGVWFINNEMQISPDRIVAANWTFQLSLLSFVISLLSVPYNSAIIAHEKMSVYAYVSIIECLIKLTIAILLPYYFTDKLIAYSALLCISSIIIRIIYQIYCNRNFEESRSFRFSIDKTIGKDLLTYSGWNIVGSTALILRQQGVNIVINVFFGTILNAAHSIAQQINGVLNQFINNVFIATRPQITKLYASGSFSEMWDLTFRSSKLVFYLSVYLCVPFLIELDELLKLWLTDVPLYTPIIAALMIITLLVETLVNQIIGVFQAANKIKTYQLFSSTILLLNIPISYLLLRLNPNVPTLPYIISCGLSFLYIISILAVAKRDVKLDIKGYLSKVILKDLIVLLTSIILTWLSVRHIHESTFRIFITASISAIYTTLLIWILGLDSKEKKYIKLLISHKITNHENPKNYR